MSHYSYLTTWTRSDQSRSSVNPFSKLFDKYDIKKLNECIDYLNNIIDHLSPVDRCAVSDNLRQLLQKLEQSTCPLQWSKNQPIDVELAQSQLSRSNVATEKKTLTTCTPQSDDELTIRLKDKPVGTKEDKKLSSSECVDDMGCRKRYLDKYGSDVVSMADDGRQEASRATVNLKYAKDVICNAVTEGDCECGYEQTIPKDVAFAKLNNYQSQPTSHQFDSDCMYTSYQMSQAQMIPSDVCTAYNAVKQEQKIDRVKLNLGTTALHKLSSMLSLMRIRDDNVLVARVKIGRCSREVVVCPNHFKTDVIWTAHKLLHEGTMKIFQKLRLTWYWPRMLSDIRRIVNSCTNCQQMKLAKKNSCVLPDCKNQQLLKRIKYGSEHNSIKDKDQVMVQHTDNG